MAQREFLFRRFDPHLDWITQDEVLTKAQKFVMAKILRYAKTRIGGCTLYNKALGRALHLHPRTVQKAIRVLLEGDEKGRIWIAKWQTNNYDRILYATPDNVPVEDKPLLKQVTMVWVHYEVEKVARKLTVRPKQKQGRFSFSGGRK